MKTYLIPFISICLSLSFISCEKEDISPLDLINDCSGSGKYLSASIGGDDFCASSSLIVALNGELNVSGISGINTTLSLQFSDTEPGSHQIDDAFNVVMLANSSGSWVTNDTLGGTLQILSHDTIDHTIAGEFSTHVLLTSGTAVLPVQGNFNLSY